MQPVTREPMDSPESRIGRLERQVATLEQSVKDVKHDVDTLAPVQMAVVRIEEQTKQVRFELGGLRDALEADRRAVKEQAAVMQRELHDLREEHAADARSNRSAIRTGAISIIVTLISVTGTILAAGAFQ